MSRTMKAALIGFAFTAAFLAASGASLADDTFSYFDFKCPKVGVERSKDVLTATFNQGGEAVAVKYVCDGRSCFNLQGLGENENGRLRIRHIYFPRGRTEFVYSTAIWSGTDDVPAYMQSRVVPLVSCGSN